MRPQLKPSCGNSDYWSHSLHGYEAVVSCRKLEIHTQQSDVVEIVVRLMRSP